MPGKRIHRFGISVLFLATILFLTISLYGIATSGHLKSQPPDLSQIDSRYILPEDQMVFSHPDGGYLAVSSDGDSKTYITELTETPTGWETRLLKRLSPAHERVLETDDCLYFLFSVTDYTEEGSGEESPAIQLTRYNIRMNDVEGRIIRNTMCDYNRICRAEHGGRLLLVTAPAFEQINDSTPISVYLFDSAAYELTAAEQLPQNPNESSPESSSSEPSNSSAPPENSSSSPEHPPSVAFYKFETPVTVAELEDHYTEQGKGIVRVTGADGTLKLKGRVVTGDIIDVWIEGRLDSRKIACISGDLTGRGRPDSSDVQLLYEHLTNGRYLNDASVTSGDFNGDGLLDTGDLLLLKELIYKRS